MIRVMYAESEDVPMVNDSVISRERLSNPGVYLLYDGTMVTIIREKPSKKNEVITKRAYISIEAFNAAYATYGLTLKKIKEMDDGK